MLIFTLYASLETEVAAKLLQDAVRQCKRGAVVRREIRLNSAQRGSSRAALAECILAERRREGTCRPHTNAARAGSHAGSQAGSQLGSEAATMEGTARLNRLAQPRTQLWEKCAAASLTWKMQIAMACRFSARIMFHGCIESALCSELSQNTLASIY